MNGRPPILSLVLKGTRRKGFRPFWGSRREAQGEGSRLTDARRTYKNKEKEEEGKKKKEGEGRRREEEENISGGLKEDKRARKIRKKRRKALVPASGATKRPRGRP